MKHLLTSLLLLSFCSSISAQNTWYIPDDFSTIQSGIDGSSNGDTVIVRDGTYFENINFNGKAITLQSENGSATTIIDGSDTDRVVVFSSGEGSSSIIRGFTVRNGHANYINSSMIGFGGGIFCKNSSSPTIGECVITNNNAENDGGGMACVDSSSPIITNCEFNSNTAIYGGGIFVYTNSSPAFVSCTFTDNASTGVGSGGGMHCDQSSSPFLQDCVFLDNSAAKGGGGLSCDDGSSPNLVNCVFTNNSALNGGGLHCGDSSPATLLNCTFIDNEASLGGGMHCYRSSPEIADCIFTSNNAGYGGAIYMFNNSPATTTHLGAENSVFSENIATLGGGAIFIDTGAVLSANNCTVTRNDSTDNNNANADGIHVYNTGEAILSNCIIWGNGTLDFVKASNASAQVEYSDIGVFWNGTGNINADPLFVDAANGDYRLQHVATGHASDSPCIDTGDPNIAPFGSTRIDGFPDLGIIDMGFRPIDTPIDSDLDGVGDDAEITLGTDPLDQDTDDDGLSDGEEVLTFSTDPLNVDTDSDGLQDGTEVGNDAWWLGDPSNGIDGTDTSVNIPDADPSTTTHPLDDDTDNDGLMDGQEDVNQNGEFLGIELDPNNFDGD
ncbi:right-handed parallel beta-helix repeat-containing protein, partial [bacterium]|nr:right-handed parallel beta-helix repeat-containing protein [bacterium]